MNRLLGRIESISAETGLKSRFRIQVAINNKNNFALDLANVSARANLTFSESDRVADWRSEGYIGEALPDVHTSTISPGDSNSLTFLLPISAELLDGIEEIRQQRDVVIQLSIRFFALERMQDGSTSCKLISDEISDSRYPGNGYIPFTIARSKWDELLIQLEYSAGLRNSMKELSRTIAEARQAKQEAEEAARAAKQAASLTAVTNLSQAYSEEAKVLNKRSLLWGRISLGVAGIGALLMSVYVKESLSDKFSLPGAVIRAITIAAVFGVFTLCLRVYESYRHLEVVNRHRVNIGRTFEAFKAAQPTERAQEVMSAITADNMLAFGKSGFAGKDSPNQGPLAGAAELIKAILEKQTH